MKLIPNRDQMQTLSSEERNYWQGYFKGFSDSTILAERNRELRRPSFAATMKALGLEGRSLYDNFNIWRQLNGQPPCSKGNPWGVNNVA